MKRLFKILICTILTTALLLPMAVYGAEASAGNLIPVPWLEVEDVVDSVLFLASDKARYVTGSQYVLDAGLLTR